MGKRSHLLFLCRGGGAGGVVRYQGVIKEKSPDFTSQEVGISGNMVSISTTLEFIWLELLMSLWNVIQIQSMGSLDTGELSKPFKLFVVWRILSSR